tara:strand:- start:60 stop:191 length:132 start_codon:yes stop_codon:yes gene_type:complete
LIDLVCDASTMAIGPKTNLPQSMRHGIDLKTHSQCQRAVAETT